MNKFIHIFGILMAVAQRSAVQKSISTNRNNVLKVDELVMTDVIQTIQIGHDLVHRYQRESITNISNEKFNQSLMNIACHHEFRANQFDLRRSNSRLIFWPPIGHGDWPVDRQEG